jgi:hypothetical protein
VTGALVRHNGLAMTDVIEPDAPPPPVDPVKPIRRERREWPPLARWAVIVLALGAAIAFFMFATRRTVVGVDGPATDKAVVSQTPGPGDRVLRQTEVGAELKPGYDGRIEVNGQAIPEDQMEGAIDPNSREAQKYGVRPNNRNKVFFKPGAGKVIGSFSGREVTITIRFWKESEGPGKARSITWQFAIT